MLEKDGKPTAGNRLEHPQSRLARVFRSGNLGCGQFPINMRLGGCPVLSVHFCFGLAPHRGHRTDNMRPSVSFSGFTATLFSINNATYSQSCCLDFNHPKTGIQAELDGALTSKGCQLCRAATRSVNSQMRGFQSAPRAPSLIGSDALKCNEAAC